VSERCADARWRGKDLQTPVPDSARHRLDMHIHSLRTLFRDTRRQLRNWPTVAPLGSLVSANRYLPPNNILMRSRLARRRMLLKVRNGMEIECRADEFAPFLEVFVALSYDIPGLDWSTVRTIVDIGANVGMATLWYASQAPNARILAVEPSREAARLLRANIARNGLEDRIIVEAVALGREHGTAVLDTSGATVTGRVRAGGPGLNVPVWTLSDVLRKHDLERVDVLKIDCEGSEYDIFEGAVEVLPHIARIVGEFDTVDDRGPSDLKRMLESAGFEVRLEPEASGLRGYFAAMRTPTP
jgi:FkbM family methyltransferase